jgi:protein-S-isoprenylcysteine O-methyltransferase Ste14
MKVYDFPENDPYVRLQREAQQREAQPRPAGQHMLVVILVLVIAAAVVTLLPGWVAVAAGVIVGGVLLTSICLMAVGIRGAQTRRSDDNDGVYKAHEQKGR